MTNHNRQDRKKWITRIVCLVIAAALLVSVAGTLIYISMIG